MKKIKSTTEQLIFTKEETLNLALGFREYADNCFTDQEQLTYYRIAKDLENRYLPNPFKRKEDNGLFWAKLDHNSNTVFQEVSESLICKLNQAIDLYNYVSDVKTFVSNEN